MGNFEARLLREEERRDAERALTAKYGDKCAYVTEVIGTYPVPCGVRAEYHTSRDMGPVAFAHRFTAPSRPTDPALGDDDGGEMVGTYLEGLPHG